MKRIILLIIIASIGCISPIYSQVRFGIKAGLNFADFKSDELSLNNATGWQAGILLQVKVPIVGLGIQPELLYSVKKADVDDQSNSISYFEVPLNVRWQFNLIAVRPYLLAGPYFSYATNSKGDSFKDVEHFDWGIGLGGGVEVWKLQLGLRYSWGLQNVDVGDFNIKNNVFTLSLAFLF